jgi:hypothetical protein
MRIMPSNEMTTFTAFDAPDMLLLKIAKLPQPLMGEVHGPPATFFSWLPNKTNFFSKAVKRLHHILH